MRSNNVRAVNGQPVSVIVEYAIIADSSIYAKYAGNNGLLGTNDIQTYAAYAKVLYAQLVNAVNYYSS